MTLHYTVCRDSEGWLVAAVPAFPGCITQAKTEEELASRVQDAAQLYLNRLRDAGVSPVEFMGLREISLE